MLLCVDLHVAHMGRVNNRGNQTTPKTGLLFDFIEFFLVYFQERKNEFVACVFLK